MNQSLTIEDYVKKSNPLPETSVILEDLLPELGEKYQQVQPGTSKIKFAKLVGETLKPEEDLTELIVEPVYQDFRGLHTDEDRRTIGLAIHQAIIDGAEATDTHLKVNAEEKAAAVFMGCLTEQRQPDMEKLRNLCPEVTDESGKVVPGQRSMTLGMISSAALRSYAVAMKSIEGKPTIVVNGLIQAPITICPSGGDFAKATKANIEATLQAYLRKEGWDKQVGVQVNLFKGGKPWLVEDVANPFLHETIQKKIVESESGCQGCESLIERSRQQS